MVGRPNVYLEKQPLQCLFSFGLCSSAPGNTTQKWSDQPLTLWMVCNETSPWESRFSRNRLVLPFLGQREFPWEKTLSRSWASGCLLEPIAKKLLEAQIAPAQEQIVLQQRDHRKNRDENCSHFYWGKKKGGRWCSKQSIIVVLWNLITFGIYKKDLHHSKEYILANFTDYASSHGEFCLYWSDPEVGLAPEMPFLLGSCFV